MTIANDLLEEVLTRLRGYSPAIVDDITRIRRDHRTALPRDDCPAIHVIDGAEIPKNAGRSCRCDVTLGFRVAIFVRDDAGYAAADALKAPIMAALDPSVSYQHKARLLRGRITSDQEIADADSVRVDMEFDFRFETAEWSLDG